MGYERAIGWGLYAGGNAVTLIWVWDLVVLHGPKATCIAMMCLFAFIGGCGYGMLEHSREDTVHETPPWRRLTPWMRWTPWKRTKARGGELLPAGPEHEDQETLMYLPEDLVRDHPEESSFRIGWRLDRRSETGRPGGRWRPVCPAHGDALCGVPRTPDCPRGDRTRIE